MKSITIPPEAKQKYNLFVASHPLGSIHQTWEWGAFQSRSAGRDKFWVVALVEERGTPSGGKPGVSPQGTILASALLIRQKLPFGKSWLYCPRGPLVDFNNAEQCELLFQHIAKIARAENAIFLRFDPGITKEYPIQNTKYKIPHAVPAHAHYQPENTLILDLTLSEEEILKQMKPKGRYNIKVAQKHGVQIRESNGATQDIELFYKLLTQTTTRDGFAGHSFKYYQDMLEILNSFQDFQGTSANSTFQMQPSAKLYLAEHQGKVIAGMIVTFFKDTAIYYFGASGNESRNVMAPYLLQWNAITEAKKLGYQKYDFLGIAPENPTEENQGFPPVANQKSVLTNHPWVGVTDFKLKFGGERVNYIPAQEIAYQKFWYLALKTTKNLKSLLK